MCTLFLCWDWLLSWEGIFIFTFKDKPESQSESCLGHKFFCGSILPSCKLWLDLPHVNAKYCLKWLVFFYLHSNFVCRCNDLWRGSYYCNWLINLGISPNHVSHKLWLVTSCSQTMVYELVHHSRPCHMSKEIYPSIMYGAYPFWRAKVAIFLEG